MTVLVVYYDFTGPSTGLLYTGEYDRLAKLNVRV